jgi:DNA-binding transcriptional regulator WhiA
MELLGGIVGSDGHLPKDSSTIQIITADKEFLESTIVPLIKELSDITVEPKLRISGFGSWRFVVSFSNKQIKQVLHEKFKIPSGKKSEVDIIPEIDEIKDKIDFIRGWFSGDGSVTTDRGRPRLTIWSKSRGILGWIQQVLKELKIDSKIWFGKTRSKWLLTIGKQNSIKRFYKLIEIPHPKKERKLISLLNIKISASPRFRTL